MESVLMSIQPKWCELIASGKKTVEVRKTKPKLETPFKVYIYCTKDKKNTFFPPLTQKLLNESPKDFVIDRRGNGKVIGEFVCNNIDWHGLSHLVVKEDAEHTLNGTCLTKEEVLNYLGYQKGTSIYACKNFDFYGWHISDLVIYDKPKELSEFHKVGYNSMLFMDFLTENASQSRYWKITRPPQSWCYVEELGA